MGMTPQEFDAFTVAEMDVAMRGYLEYVVRPAWLMAAFTGACAMQPWSKKTINPKALLGWDDAEKKKESRMKSKLEIRQDMAQLKKELG